MANIDVLFNGKTVVADDSMTILDLAQREGIEIPTMCHDPRLEAYGSCFVCVAEVKGARTLVPSCATKLRSGMEILTNSERVVSSRKTALELIVSNHYGDCVGPCKLTCPANCDVQGYVGLIANKKYKDALILIKDTIPLPASIGRVCPKFCEDKCRRESVEEPVAIDYLKRFVADMDLASGNPYMPLKKPSIGKKVAIVGGGPAGLAAAYYLIQDGVDVEIFEAQNTLGGMLLYGIPEYRLPKEVLAKEIATIIDLGVKVHFNKSLGKDFTIDSLKADKYDAIFLGFGAWKASKLGIPGDDATNVYDGIEFLEKLGKKEKITLSGRVAVVGGGNTAFDCARTALRLGADEVVMVYRRTKEEMPANEIEKEEAHEEGIEFMLLTAPLAVNKTGVKADGLRLQKMRQGEPDASGRRSPVPIEGSEFDEKFDYIITAVGQGPDLEVLGNYKDKLVQGRGMKYNADTGVTAVDFIFAGGDCALGAKTVVEALGSSKKAAKSIVKYLNGETISYKKEFFSVREKSDGTIDPSFAAQFKKEPRNTIAVLSPEKRRKCFDEIESAFTEDKAVKEASRCMECGCMDVYECSLKKYSDDYNVNEYKYEGEMNTSSVDNSSPYISRDISKCVLCGRCIRLCSEKVQLGVYGYVDRGFETVVSPEFRKNLKDSDCISCGLCISGCPVGALVPNTMSDKKVPLNPPKVDGFCSHCSIGCMTTASVLTDSVYEIKENGKYLCKKGRFNFPEFITENTNIDYSQLLAIKDADVYPSASLSVEDYEALKKFGSSNGWKIHNYYSQSSLLQAYSTAQSYPSQSFAKEGLKNNSLVIIAGDIETINPTALNRLSDIVLADTKIAFYGKNPGKRVSRFQPIIADKADKLTGLDIKEVVLLINAVDFDKTFGFETSLSLYKTLEKAYGSVKVTVFSETKNLYSIIDAAKIEDEKKAVKIYIGTGTSSEISDYNITIVENGKVSASLQYAGNAVSSGTYVSSMDKMYTNVPLYKTKLKSLKDILSVGSVAITDIGAIQREKTGIVIKKISMDVKNTFVERCSKK
ncbi:MAG: hypothetical protein A2015_00130 [Spirochaetes bacterium GWF1_31_7]|nr:MAG: hypothetical protein A2Y30_04380 [Spirochaetes bacterium GWE1_32_154]OHD50997.1 MAG: hypothetical protein A2015_00130 [Spirochaetes bacterium GWF1_31_7]HBD94312.1 molybdopterin oxidoreductase [Spirochaetia bacterium]HBI37933.1 molybdopterin oxidoreductase [Spirochaetia bacterium]